MIPEERRIAVMVRRWGGPRNGPMEEMTVLADCYGVWAVHQPPDRTWVKHYRTPPWVVSHAVLGLVVVTFVDKGSAKFLAFSLNDEIGDPFEGLCETLFCPVQPLLGGRC